MSHKLVSLYIGEGEYYTKTDTDNVIAEKDKEIAELKEERKWRKCSDEMPQKYDDGDSFLVAVKHESTTCPKGYYVTIAELFDGNWYDEEGRDIDEDTEFDLPKGTNIGFYRSKVTYWMPLPSAPKEEE